MYTTHSRPRRAATVADATPCWPAPVSAMIRVLPMRAREQRLADGVVDLVRAGVVEVLALEQDARAADFAAQALGVVDRARAADVVREVVLELGDELRIDARRVVGRGQFLQRPDQRFGDEAAAVAAEMAGASG